MHKITALAMELLTDVSRWRQGESVFSKSAALGYINLDTVEDNSDRNIWIA